MGISRIKKVYSLLSYQQISYNIVAIKNKWPLLNFIYTSVSKFNANSQNHMSFMKHVTCIYFA